MEGLEIIFVSSDHSPEDMEAYMKESHGDWWGVEHGSSAAEALKTHFKVRGIPALIVLDKNGDVITKEGRADVQAKGPGAVALWKVWMLLRAQLFHGSKRETSCTEEEGTVSGPYCILKEKTRKLFHRNDRELPALYRRIFGWFILWPFSCKYNTNIRQIACRPPALCLYNTTSLFTTVENNRKFT